MPPLFAHGNRAPSIQTFSLYWLGFLECAPVGVVLEPL